MDREEAIKIIQRRAMKYIARQRHLNNTIASRRKNEPISGSHNYLHKGRGILFPVGQKSNGELIWRTEDADFLAEWLSRNPTNPWTRGTLGSPTLPKSAFCAVMRKVRKPHPSCPPLPPILPTRANLAYGQAASALLRRITEAAEQNNTYWPSYRDIYRFGMLQVDTTDSADMKQAKHDVNLVLIALSDMNYPLTHHLLSMLAEWAFEDHKSFHKLVLTSRKYLDRNINDRHFTKFLNEHNLPWSNVLYHSNSNE